MDDQQPCSSRSQRLKRTAKPTIDDLKDGRNRYLHLVDAIEATEKGDTIAILPPVASDEEDIGEERHEPIDVAGILEIVRPKEDDVPAKNPHERPWKRNKKIKELEDGPRIPSLSETHPLLATLSPLQLFRLYYTNEVVNMMVQMSTQYAREQGDMTFTVTVDEMDNFILILLYASYVRLPRQEMYWERDFDLDLPFAQRIMSRQKFRNIKKYLHFCDNNTIDVQNNRFAKVQPLFDLLNASLVQFGILCDSLCVDEQMVGYTGRHPTKQYIRGKPVKWGYKLWVMCDETGYPYHIWPYQGRCGPQRDEPLGSIVVKKMKDVIQQVSSPSSHKIYMDNFFTSLNLLEELGEQNLRASGVIRSNRIGKAPLKRDVELPNRGDYDSVSNGVVRLIKLHDSKIVTLATNFDSVEPLHLTSRHSKVSLDRLKIPNAFHRYNLSMGGVDLTDRFVADYPTSITGKKWYWPLFTNCLGLMRVAAWRLFAHAHHGRSPLDQLAFLRKIVQDMASSVSRQEKPQCGPSGRFLPQESIHVQVAAVKQGRCRVCHKHCRNKCSSCNVYLHNHCSSLFAHA
jgi:DNA excision repair protein ERCC-6